MNEPVRPCARSNALGKPRLKERCQRLFGLSCSLVDRIEALRRLIVAFVEFRPEPPRPAGRSDRWRIAVASVLLHPKLELRFELEDAHQHRRAELARPCAASRASSLARSGVPGSVCPLPIVPMVLVRCERDRRAVEQLLLAELNSTRPAPTDREDDQKEERAQHASIMRQTAAIAWRSICKLDRGFGPLPWSAPVPRHWRRRYGVAGPSVKA